ncbi:MAG: sugar ABC transporter permease [Oscillospiraceae bacterium]|nr:sugar ABC transporter permease [Oscillospiraceae bacterium]
MTRNAARGRLLSPAGRAGDLVYRTWMLWPALVLLAIFFIWPIIMALYYSFTNLALSGSAAGNLRFTGLANYSRMMKDADMLSSIRATLLFLIGSVVGQTVLGFFMALLMKGKSTTFRRITGSCVLTGWVMPEVVAAICMYAFFYSKDSGTVNRIIGVFGAQPVAWLYKHALLSVTIANIWHGAAYSMMVFQAALDNVSADTEESAMLDGANRIQTLIHIYIPQVKSTIFSNTMLITLKTIGVFDLIFTMTGGGPGGKTQTLPVYMYLQAFKSFQLGYGSAISVVLLALGIMLSVLYTRVYKE